MSAYNVFRLVRNENALAKSCEIVFVWNDLLAICDYTSWDQCIIYKFLSNSDASLVMVAVKAADGTAENELELRSLRNSQLINMRKVVYWIAYSVVIVVWIVLKAPVVIAVIWHPESNLMVQMSNRDINSNPNSRTKSSALPCQ